MSIEKSLDIIYSFYNKVGKNVPLDLHDSEFRNPDFTKQLLCRCDTKLDIGKNIIIVGSKGKGSTAEILAEILKRHGARVGLFKSPHLVDFKERIQVNGQKISAEDFNRLTTQLKEPINNVGSNISWPGYLGPNAILLAMALNYFNEHQTDYNILESGRGGEYDDTFMLGRNIIFTPIFLEHKYRLGKTIKDIAQTKINALNTKTTNAICSKQVNDVVLPLFKKKAHEHNISSKIFEQDFRVSSVKHNKTYTEASLEIEKEIYNLNFPHIPLYIMENFANAAAAARFFCEMDLNEKKLNEMSHNLTLDGRCEVMTVEDKTFIFDGLVSSESAREVSLFIDSLPTKGKKGCLLALPKDKDLEGVVDVLKSKFDLLILTKASKTQYPFENTISSYNDILVSDNPTDGLKTLYNNKITNICVFGTQSLLGEVKKYIQTC
ncbi:hypothetical protein PRVXH_000904 [Proteinivorax hydrogeniformans]|uniref:Mur ligase central domain-containing protein n=1 Tax=Proteinivorax hydrogeniformans TaxID=1826727 RepID=A0AAU8HW30_9FIRM